MDSSDRSHRSTLDEPAVNYFNLVADGVTRRTIEREAAAVTVIHAHRDLVFLDRLHSLLDFITSERAAQGTGYSGYRITATVANLIAHEPADERAWDGLRLVLDDLDDAELRALHADQWAKHQTWTAAGRS